LAPGTGGAAGAAGFLALAQFKELPYSCWLISLVPDHASPENAAQLVALLLVDEALGVLPQVVMPPRPRMAYLQPNGTMLDVMRRSLPPPVLGEVTRVAQELVARHATYLTDMVMVFRGEIPGDRFETVPQDHPLGPEPGTYFAPQLPPVAVRSPTL
jgi:hypothetical protein